MLQTNRPAAAPLVEDRAGFDAGSLTDTFQALTGLLRRRFPIFIAVTLGTLAIGIAYLIITPSVYTAVATMVIDTHKVQLYQQQSATAEQPIDAGTVQTQVEVMKSQNVDAAVVKDLRLTEDPEFLLGRPGFISSITGLFGHYMAAQPVLTEDQAMRRALGFFNANRTVSRLGQTYVMEVAFRSVDPDKAARIANAIVDAYITDQLEAKFQSTKRASLWLQDRIGELRAQASTADRAVVDFKTSNNIVDADGKLMNEQQLSEVNSQLMLANAATAEAKARLDRMDDVMKEPIPDASVADALKSSIIINLRQQYLELAGRESIYSARYGANHEAVVNLRTQMNELRRSIADEMHKIAESYKSDYAIAQAREAALRTSLKSSVTESQTTNQAQVQMRELQSNAQSYRSLYDNFLQRYMDAVQQQSFPLTEARLISPAERPGVRSKPSLVGVIGASLASGLLLSFGLAMFRELADRVFRSSAQVEEKLGLECLATMPLVRENGRPGRATLPVEPPPGSRAITLAPGLWRHAVDQPFSAFSEALRSIKVAVDLAATGRASTVLGITSTLPSEGKSTIAVNFAALLSHAGARVLLVDADLRNPSLSRMLSPLAEGGLVDLINGRGAIDDLVWSEGASQLAFLPAGATPRLMHTNALLSSEGVRSVFDAARARYDYIIVDLAPLAPVVDTRTTVHFVDAYVYAVEWGRTRIDVVEDVLGKAREIHDSILGVVLNKADLSVLGRYERHQGQSYHRKYYSRYGYTA